MRNEIEQYAIEQANHINNLTGTSMENYIYNMIDLIGTEEEIILGEEDNILDLSNEDAKLEVLMAIYENIKNEEDKKIFANEIIESKHFSKASEAFENMLKLDAGTGEETETEVEKEEEIEETVETPINTETYDDMSETKEEENQEEVKEENDEIDAITVYKNETEELKSKLSELENEYNKLLSENSIPEPEIDEKSDKMDELIEKTDYDEDIQDNKEIERLQEEKGIWERRKENFLEENPNYQSFENLVREYRYIEKYIEKIENEIEEKKKESKEREIPSKLTILVKTTEFRKIYENEINKLQEVYKELEVIQNNLYKENKGIPLEIYGMKSKIEQIVEKMKKDLHEKCGIRTEININSEENKILIDNVKDCRKIYEDSKMGLKEQFGVEIKDTKETEEPKIDNPELTAIKEAIDKTKEEIAKREQNIATYYEALEDINEIDRDIKSGKKQNSEEIQNKVTAVREKIEKLPPELKEELEKKLTKALGKRRRKVKEVIKDIKDWFDKHPVIKMIALGLALTLTSQLALGALMMTNSALYNAIAGGLAIKDAPAFAQFLHSVNMALSKVVGFGQYKFVDGLYTLGGKAGAPALYTAAKGLLGNALVATVGIGSGIGVVKSGKGLFKAIKEKWENRKNKKEKGELKLSKFKDKLVGIKDKFKGKEYEEELDEELEEEQEIEEEKEEENKDTITVSKAKLEELIKQQVIESTKGLIEQNRKLIEENESLKSQLEDLTTEKENSKTL